MVNQVLTAVSRKVFCNVETSRPDTAEVAPVKFNGRVTNAEREKPARYLEARLGSKKVHIIDL